MFITRFQTIERGALQFIGNTLGLSSNGSQVCTPGKTDGIGTYIKYEPGCPTICSNCGTTPLSLGTHGATTALFSQNLSCSSLNLPVNSKILYAELIWGGTYLISGGENNSAFINNPIRFDTPSASNFMISPETAFTFAITSNNDMAYINSAQVTALVAAGENGQYCAGNIVGTLVPDPRTTSFAGWTLAVAYANASLPYRSLSIYVGNVNIKASSGPVDTPLGNFTVPTVGSPQGFLFISAQEGDANKTGDQLLFGPTTAGLVQLPRLIPPSQSISNNFFQSLIFDNAGNTDFDPTSTFSDRNPIPGTPGSNLSTGSRQGLDIAKAEVTSTLSPGQSSAIVRITTNGDGYAVNGVGLQIDNVDPVLQVLKFHLPLQACVGRPLIYVIAVVATGNTAQNVVLMDQLPSPADVTINSVSPLLECPGPYPGNLITCNLGTVSPDEPRFIFINVTPNVTGNLSNTATVTSDAETVTVTDSVNVESCMAPPMPEIEIEKFATPSPVVVGGESSFIIVVSNTGDTNLTNLVVNDLIPPSLVVIGTEESAGTAVVIMNQINWTIPTLNVGDSASLVVNVMTTEEGTFENCATVTTTELPLPQQSCGTLVVLPPLLLTKEASSGPVIVGDVFEYLVTISNVGNETIFNVTVTDTLPPSVRFISADNPRGTCTFADNIVTCNVDFINPFEQFTIAIRVIPTQVGTLVNTVCIQYLLTTDCATLTIEADPRVGEAHCINARKIYDWTVVSSNTTVSVPISPECLEMIGPIPLDELIIDCLIPDMNPFQLGMCAPSSIESICEVFGIRRGIPGSVNQAALVKLAQSLPISIIISRPTLGGNTEEICRIPFTVTVYDKVVLCLPEPLDKKNIFSNVVDIQCNVTPVICNDTLEVSVSLCTSVQVEAGVTLEILGEFCQPRPPIL